MRPLPHVRRTLLALVALSAALGVLPLVPGRADAASAKVTICHRTHSTSNPYRRITVSQNAITRNAGHGDHEADSGLPAVFDPGYSYAPNQKSWGDIIPGADADGTPFNGSNSFDLNWTAAGKAAFAAHCALMTAKEFYDVEVAAGVDPAAVIADLNAQSANEDAALLAALGGTFTAGSVSSWDTTISATTSAATNVAATTATLNGTLKVGATTTVSGFQWGTTTALGSSVAATPGSVTNETAVSANLTGLTGGTTYYFRVTGTTNAGADTEGVLYGEIESFTTTGSTPQTISFTDPSAMVLGSGTQQAAATATSGLAVGFTSGSTGVCTVTSAGVITAVAAGTCSITAAQPGNSTYAPATSVTKTFSVTALARTLDIDAASYDAGGYLTTATPPTITSTPSAGTGTRTYTSSTPGVCTIGATTGVVTFVSSGTCTIGASIAAAGSYGPATASTISFPLTAPTARTLSIDPASYAAAGYSLADAAPTVVAAPSAGTGSGTITYTSSTPGACTVAGATGAVTFVSAGTCTIGASITAGGTWGPATASTVSFPLAGAARTLTIDPASYSASGYVATATPPTVVAAPSAGTGSGTLGYSSSTTAVCTVAAGTGAVTFVGTGTCTIGATITTGGIWNAATATGVSFPVVAARTLAIDPASYAAAGYARTANPPTVVATPSAGSGTGTIAYVSTTAAVCTVAAGTGAVTFVGTGTCTIGATISAGGIWNAATATNVSFPVVADRSLAIDPSSYAAAGYASDDAPPTIVATPSAGAGIGTITYSFGDVDVCTVNALTGVVTFTGTGTCTIGASITAAGSWNAATATTISFPVRPAPSGGGGGGGDDDDEPPVEDEPADDDETVPADEPLAGDEDPGQVRGDGESRGGSRVRGVVWFDRNRNGRFDGREWVLPGVPVTLRDASVEAAAFRTAALEEPRTVTSGRDGSYTFDGLAPGAYVVSATAQIKGFDYTSDSDGDLDWRVTVDVPDGAEGVADFAGLGRGEVVGKMFETATLEGLGFATITCQWGGFDDQLGTPDDVPFDVTAAPDGTFDLPGVPYGVFSCSGVDGAGRAAKSLTVSVFSPEPAQVPLPVTSPRVRNASLARTGADVGGAVALGSGLLATGLALVVLVRRRRPSLP